MKESMILFSKTQEEEEVFHQEDLVALFPFGLSLNQDATRPILLLKDAQHDLTLPVAINPLEAGATLSQTSSQVNPSTPHRFTQLLLSSLNIEIKQCVFVQVKGVHQYVRIYFSGHPYVNSLKLRADEAMSLCVSLNVPLFASRKIIEASKMMTAEIQGMNETVMRDPRVLDKKHHWLM